MEKFAEDDRIDEMNRQKRAAAKAEHSRKVAQLLEEKRRIAEEDRQREEAIAAQARARDAEFQQIVEEERQRLLREHAANLDGHLPKGVVQNEHDADIVRGTRSAGPNLRAQF